MATIKDISALLGLSITTVSRALNGFPEVSAATRERVQKVAKELNYSPNHSARRLVTGRSNIVALVLCANPNLELDPYVYEIVTGLSARLLERNRDLIVHVATDADPVAPLRRLLASNTVDGFLLNAPEVDDARVNFLVGANARFVLHGRHSDDVGYAFYDIDNRGAGRMATEVLVKLGHRRIALVNGGRKFAYAAERRAGYLEALDASGLTVPASFIAHVDLTQSDATDFVTAALNGEFGAPPTAFVCASTPLAASVVRAARMSGLEIGSDVSIVSHDDCFPQIRAEDFDPPLSTIHSPLKEACLPLASMICDLLDGAMEQPRQVTAPVAFVNRASAGVAPADATTASA